MWFGTRAFMQEIANPLVRPEVARAGWQDSTTYLSGRRQLTGSANAHREVFFTWPHLSREKVQQITDYADGVYGADERGSGPFYWVDPYSVDLNVLPQAGATPSLAGYDAVPLAGEDRPVLSPQPDQSQGYPTEKVTYTLTEGMTVRPLSVPIPPGHVAWVGVHGDGDAAGRVKVTPFVGAVAGAVVHPTILSVATATRVNTMVEGTWLEIALDPTSPGECTLAGLIVQILPDGQTPSAGGFISGQGHGGCRFEGRPTVVPLVVDGEQSFVQVSGKLVEVG